MPLIVLEGLDGCGKSTQAARLVERLQREGQSVLRLREPGGTPLGEAVRGILLDPLTVACPEAELFGYLMARAQLCHDIIAPALARGEWVILDRFWYSTVAYQAYGHGMDPARVRAAIDLAIGDIRADAALLLRVTTVAATTRRLARAATADRIESRDVSYHARVEAGYAAMVAFGELTLIEASGTPSEVAERIWQAIPAR